MQESRIFILGSKENLSNELLLYALEREANIPCTFTENASSIIGLDEANQMKNILVLIDSGKEGFADILTDLKNQNKAEYPPYIIAYYNLAHDLEIERDSLRLGVRGFFYRQDSLDLLLKGITNLISGEIWLSRDILFNLALRNSRFRIAADHENADLTRREIEILAHVSLGETNEEIAQKLNISPHTVKTHLYKTYKKINVNNRFQATLWAAKNL